MTTGRTVRDRSVTGGVDAEWIVNTVLGNERDLDSVFRGISDGMPRIRFSNSKALVLLSERSPALVLNKLGRVVALLGSENRILRWNAISILGNLAAADAERKIKGSLKQLFNFLACGELITANNAIVALGKIARAFPEERKRIVARLLEVEHASFETGECRNIALGKLILAIQSFCDPSNPGQAVTDFIRRQTHNRRPATARKANAFLALCERDKA